MSPRQVAATTIQRDWCVNPDDAINLIENLPRLVHDVRVSRGWSQREVARQVGISFSTVSRAESGQELSSRNAVALLRWLGEATS